MNGIGLLPVNVIGKSWNPEPLIVPVIVFPFRVPTNVAGSYSALVMVTFRAGLLNDPVTDRFTEAVGPLIVHSPVTSVPDWERDMVMSIPCELPLQPPVTEAGSGPVTSSPSSPPQLAKRMRARLRNSTRTSRPPGEWSR